MRSSLVVGGLCDPCMTTTARHSAYCYGVLKEAVEDMSG